MYLHLVRTQFQRKLTGGQKKSDLDILCQRFTTSKLSKFEDLSSIATYGFRGEALASISHISHLTVTTKQKGSPCAWRVTYLDGKPTPIGSAPTAVAGRDGTQITVEDLFYNVPSRLRAFKLPAEEYGKILDVVGRYACHCRDVSFSCKKFGDSYPSLSVPAASKPMDRIRSVYGTAIASELISIQVPANERYAFQGASGYVTNPNYSSKKSIAPVLFINHRSVSCDPLRKALNGIYATHLPRGGHSFVYMALDIDPRNLDVNVHPTKREVRFLYEDEIIGLVCEAVQEALASCGNSRNFQTQTIFPGSRSATLLSSGTATPPKRPYEYNLVRTDSKQTKLTTLFASTPGKSYAEDDSMTMIGGSMSPSSSNIGHGHGHNHGDTPDTTRIPSTPSSSTIPLASQFRHVLDRDRVDVRLKSIKSIRDDIESAAHESLTRVFSEHTYIGVVDFNRRLCAFQQGVRMFIVDYGVLAQELFYQAAIADFGNFGTLSLVQEDDDEGDEGEGEGEGEGENDPGLSVRQLLLNDPDTDVNSLVDQLWDMHQMFQEYYSITFTKSSTKSSTSTSAKSFDLRLTTLPMLIKGYLPPFSKLPHFLRSLATQVLWDSEQDCLRDIARALAKFYTPEPLLNLSMNNDEEEDEDDEMQQQQRQEQEQEQQKINEAVERLIFPAVKQRLLAPKWMVDHVVEIANLPGLYKVFERC